MQVIKEYEGTQPVRIVKYNHKRYVVEFFIDHTWHRIMRNECHDRSSFKTLQKAQNYVFVGLRIEKADHGIWTELLEQTPTM